MRNNERYVKTLKEHGLSNTKQRQLIFNALMEHTKPITISQLRALIPNTDTVTVYRTIDTFIEIGLVKKIWQGFKLHIEISDIFSPHHHHISCIKCGRVDTFYEGNQLIASFQAIAKQKGYSILDHHLDIKGYCKDCTPIQQDNT